VSAPEHDRDVIEEVFDRHVHLAAEQSRLAFELHEARDREARLRRALPALRPLTSTERDAQARELYDAIENVKRLTKAEALARKDYRTFHKLSRGLLAGEQQQLFDPEELCP
jgi:hypothetical protein